MGYTVSGVRAHGVHRAPGVGRGRRVLRVLAGTAVVAVSVTAGGLVSVPARAAVAVRVSYAARACLAFAAYERAPDSARLDALMTVSERAPWRYLGRDVASLYVDHRAGAGKWYGADAKYVRGDC